MHYIINESLTLKRFSSAEHSMMKEECRKSNFELNEMAKHLSPSRTTSATMEKLVPDWKEECRLVVRKSRDKEDRYEAEVVTMKSELLSISQAVVAYRLKTQWLQTKHCCRHA